MLQTRDSFSRGGTTVEWRVALHTRRFGCDAMVGAVRRGLDEGWRSSEVGGDATPGDSFVSPESADELDGVSLGWWVRYSLR